jgi:hypothetical protein
MLLPLHLNTEQMLGPVDAKLDDRLRRGRRRALWWPLFCDTLWRLVT